MENQFSSIFTELLDRFKVHLETRKELLKLRFLDRFSMFLASVTTMGFLMLSGLFVLFFIGIGLAIVINNYMESNYWGYFIVAGVWLVVIVALFINVLRTGIPLFTNRFIQILSVVFDVEEEEHDKK